MVLIASEYQESEYARILRIAGLTRIMDCSKQSSKPKLKSSLGK